MGGFWTRDNFRSRAEIKTILKRALKILKLFIKTSYCHFRIIWTQYNAGFSGSEIQAGDL